MRGYDKIVLNSSPHGLPFYEHFGFTVEEEEKMQIPHGKHL